jgi:hypothetical protein
VFESSRPSLFLDYFRIPYRVSQLEAPPGFARLKLADEPSHSILWRVFDDDSVPPRRFSFGDLSLVGRLGPEAAAERPITIDDCLEDGDLVLPFDPDDVMLSFWSEAYLSPQNAVRSRGKQVAFRAYYALRPLMPRGLQIWLRRRFSSVQARARFPRWPAETALHDLYDLLLARLALVAGRPVPWIAHWPEPYRWALVLSHDVEHRVGYENLHLLGDVELELGYASSWNFVPERDYDVEPGRLDGLRRDGFEIGLHGLRHDGRDLESRTTLERRLPAMMAYAERWGAVGFRAPATHRDWELMPLLGVDYDSSSPDTDPFEPKSGGCCTWLPFFNRDLVELPITLTQDHTMFVILERRDDALWREKAELLRDRGGMALLLTHPDYMLDPRLIDLYRGFLSTYATDPTAWKARPLDVASWWRRRSESRLAPSATGWDILGPAAADGRVEFVVPS